MTLAAAVVLGRGDAAPAKLPGVPVAAEAFVHGPFASEVDPARMRLVASVEAGGTEHGVVVAPARAGGDLWVSNAMLRAERVVGLGEFRPLDSAPSAPPAPPGYGLTRWQAANAPVVHFQLGGGGRPDRVDWEIVMGIARGHVARVLARFGDGSRTAVPLNAWRAFTYSGDPARFPVWLEAYAGDGAVLGTVELARPGPLCGGAAGPCDPELQDLVAR